jgi:hypothetical protein
MSLPDTQKLTLTVGFRVRKLGFHELVSVHVSPRGYGSLYQCFSCLHILILIKPFLEILVFRIQSKISLRSQDTKYTSDNHTTFRMDK